MNYPTCWSLSRVREVFTTESRQKSRDLFLQTHRPFQRIRVDFCKEQTHPTHFMTEDQIRDMIVHGPLDADNRLFFIVGEAGSGKSELCQWLEYTVDQTKRLPIHIPRSMTSAAHVVALLQQRVEKQAGFSAFQRIPIATQAEYIALTAVMVLYEHNSPLLMPVALWEDFFTSAVLKHVIVAHLESAAAGQWHHRLIESYNHFATLCDQCGIVPTSGHREDVWQAIQYILDRALEQTLWFGDMRVLLAEMGEHVLAQGRRPLLLLEDITTFRMLGDRLLDYLLDLTSGHMDAVIGVTTGFERTQLAGATLSGDLTHIHHRLRARFVLSDDAGRSYGFAEDVIAFARTYLDAVKHGCGRCAQREDCERIFGNGLYPFTETALLRAFQSLQEEGNPRQTPRLFLEHILAAVLQSQTIPPITLDSSSYLESPPTIFRSDEVADATMHTLLRWYGTITDTSVQLDRRIADFWHISVPSSLILDNANTIQVSRAYIASPPEIPLSDDWHEELRELQHWLTYGGIYPHRETLKRGIERVLFLHGDPRSLANPHALSLSKAEIFYARGDERIPIFLGRESGDQPITQSSLKVAITGTPEERGLLEELVYLALSRGDIPHVCRNIALTLEWSSQHWDAYNQEIHTVLQTHLGGMRAEELVLMVWHMLTVLSGHTTDVQQIVLPQADTSGQPYAITTPWCPTMQNACYKSGESLMAWKETIYRLCIGIFFLRDTLLDRQRYDAVIEHFDRGMCLDQCAALPLSTLRTLPFRIRPMGVKLFDVLVPIQRYAHALTTFDVHNAFQHDLTQLKTWGSHLNYQQMIDIEQLRTSLTTIRWRCSEVGVTWSEPWDAAWDFLYTLTSGQVQDLQIQVATLLKYATIQEKEREQSLDLWTYQQFRHTLRPLLHHPYWKAVETVQSIQKTLMNTARERYKAKGKTITGTKPYKACLHTIRSIRQELKHG